MVWALLPVQSIPGDKEYYIFSKGTYKVGRKGSDVIVNQDKGVSRIHAEIVIDAMTSSYTGEGIPSNLMTSVQIRDCSKYGTFIQRNLAVSKVKIHELPNKRTSLEDGDLISFGTGNVTYRFCSVPLIILVCDLEPPQVPLQLQERISSIGARITQTLDEECTHVLVEQFMPIKEDIFDAVVAKKPVILSEWIEVLAGEKIQNNVPSYISYLPTLSLDGLLVKIIDPQARKNCLEGFTFVMDSAYKYKFGKKLRPLLEASGAEVLSMPSFCSSTQGLKDGEDTKMVHVLPVGSSHKIDTKLSSLNKISEVDLVRAVLCGKISPSVLIPPSVLVSSSCSTDETVVADSDEEVETTTSIQRTVTHAIDIKAEPGLSLSKDGAAKLETHEITSFRDKSDGSMAKEGEESKRGSSEIIYSQDLIVRDVNLSSSFQSPTVIHQINFKRFRKPTIQSGNSFINLIPFSKCAYRESEYESEVVESMKEEKKRKQMEKIAEELFRTEKGKKRAAPGSLHGILTRG